MFQTGEKILYPMHGICRIENLEEKDILGEITLCYIVNVSRIGMQVAIPVSKAENLGIRYAVATEMLESVLREFNLGETDPLVFENQRFCKESSKKKLKSGDIWQEREVIRDLTRKAQRSKLGPEDSTMLENARRIFISELMEVKGLEQEEAMQLLEEIMNMNKEAIS